jgi:hypothetical protein
LPNGFNRRFCIAKTSASGSDDKKDIGNVHRTASEGANMPFKQCLALAAVILLSGCVQDGATPYTGGPRDVNSSTVFNLSLTPASLPNCMMADPGMTRPMTVTVANDSGMLLTEGGIHYGLTRVAPSVYAGGDWIKIRANLSVSPKTLAISTNDSRCIWAGTAL